MTQSGVSKSLERLEGYLSLTLIDRTTRPIRITAEGKVIFEEFVNCSQVLAESFRRIKSCNMLKPALTLAMTESLSVDLAPDLMEQLVKQTSKLTMLTGSSDVLLAHLLQRKADIIIVSAQFPEEKNVDRYFLFSEPSILLLPPTFPDKIWTWQDLHFCGLPIISAYPRLGGGRLNSSYFSTIQEDFPSRIFVDLNAIIVPLIQKGLGWALSRPSTLVQTKTPKETLKVAPMPEPLLSRSLFIMARKGELRTEVRKIQQISREILIHKIFPKLIEIAPWLKEDLKVVAEDGIGQISARCAFSAIPAES